MLGYRVQEMCTELKDKYYRLWGPCALAVKENNRPETNRATAARGNCGRLCYHRLRLKVRGLATRKKECLAAGQSGNPRYTICFAMCDREDAMEEKPVTVQFDQALGVEIVPAGGGLAIAFKTKSGVKGAILPVGTLSQFAALLFKKAQSLPEDKQKEFLAVPIPASRAGFAPVANKNETHLFVKVGNVPLSFVVDKSAMLHACRQFVANSQN